jgi:hypothetical protein
MLREFLRDRPHAPANATAREKAVRDLFDVIEEGPPVELVVSGRSSIPAKPDPSPSRQTRH